MTALYVPVGLSALSIAWFLTRRELPPTEELLRKLRPDTLKGLDKFLPYNPIKGLIESDESFWRISEGYRGLLSRIGNAVCYIQLSQQLERDHRMPRDAVRCIFVKALWQLFFSIGSLPEEFFRIFIRSMPHFCARIATHFYWELSNQAEALNAQFGIESWMSHV
jgi:hypothetical protein